MQPFYTSSLPPACYQPALEPYAAFIGRSLGLLDISRCESWYRTRSTLMANKLKVSRKSVLSLVTTCLLLSGDVELNPGPKYKFPCSSCEKSVRANQKGLQCDECDKWFHSVCEQVPPGDRFCHLNVRSLLRCVDEIHDLIASIGDGRLYLSLSETWLDTNCPDGVVSIPGYRIFRRDRCGRGGGVAIFCPDNPRCKRREDLECNYLETVWIELDSSKKKPLLVCTIYCPPDAGCQFFNSLSSCWRMPTRNVRRSW